MTAFHLECRNCGATLLEGAEQRGGYCLSVAGCRGPTGITYRAPQLRDDRIRCRRLGHHWLWSDGPRGEQRCSVCGVTRNDEARRNPDIGVT